MLPPSGTGPAENHLPDALAAVHAVRDVIDHYLTRRCSELAWGAAQVASGLARDTLDPSAAAAFGDVRRFLSEASLFGRDGTRDADAAIGALSLTLPVSPVQADAADRTQDVPANLAEDCDRLSRAAFETLHHRSEHRMSGSDLQQLARWTAIQRLLAGRVLLQVAEELPDEAATALRESTGALRGSAQVWQKSATAWHRIVDIADPRSHPKLPAPSYEIVRRGEVVRLPRVIPHPATVIAHTAAVRVGQLLYGPEWRPEAAARPDPRGGAEILADARGAGGLASALYRLPAAGWQLALAAPQAVSLARGGLVTDALEHQEPGRRNHRFRPIRLHQLEALSHSYKAVLPAEQASAESLLNVARQAGVPVPPSPAGCRRTPDPGGRAGLWAGPEGGQGGSDRTPSAAAAGTAAAKGSVVPSDAFAPLSEWPATT
ncbi:hypothetical protein [Streptomyces sp. NPDC088746]|uniref:hypothetical protein n=1 Tax=Streptomyces sp. NPDC088746 TaxID=3365885 RepID=UPI003812D407